MAESRDRPLTPDEANYVTAARDKAFILYEGRVVPHRNCGIALAETLRAASAWFQGAWLTRLRGGDPDIVCDRLVRGEFTGPGREAFCTSLAAEVAALTAEALCRFGSQRLPITPIETP